MLILRIRMLWLIFQSWKRMEQVKKKRPTSFQRASTNQRINDLLQKFGSRHLYQIWLFKRTVLFSFPLFPSTSHLSSTPLFPTLFYSLLMTSMRFLALIALLPSLVLSAPLDVKRAQGQSLPPPSLDPFYKVPSNISTYERGQVVEKRDVATNVDGGNTATSYQVSQRLSRIRTKMKIAERRWRREENEAPGFLSDCRLESTSLKLPWLMKAFVLDLSNQQVSYRSTTTLQNPDLTVGS